MEVLSLACVVRMESRQKNADGPISKSKKIVFRRKCERKTYFLTAFAPVETLVGRGENKRKEKEI